MARFGKEKDILQQWVHHLRSTVEVLQQAANQAKAETVGLRSDVVRLTEENSQLGLERDIPLQVRERALQIRPGCGNRCTVLVVIVPSLPMGRDGIDSDPMSVSS